MKCPKCPREFGDRDYGKLAKHLRSHVKLEFHKIDFWLGICLGIIIHDLVSVFAPHGGHIPDLHAYYFAAPLLIISLLWRQQKIGRWKAVFLFTAYAGMLLTAVGLLLGVFA